MDPMQLAFEHAAGKAKTAILSAFGRVSDGARHTWQDVMGVFGDYYYVWWLFDSKNDFDTVARHPHNYPRQRGDIKPYVTTPIDKQTADALAGTFTGGKVVGTCLGLGQISPDAQFRTTIPITQIASLLPKEGAYLALGAARRRMFKGVIGRVDPEALLWNWTGMPFSLVKRTIRKGTPTKPTDKPDPSDDKPVRPAEATPSRKPVTVEPERRELVSPTKIAVRVHQYAVGESRDTLFTKAASMPLDEVERFSLDAPVGEFHLKYSIVDKKGDVVLTKVLKFNGGAFEISADLPASFTLELSTLEGFGIWAWQAGRGPLRNDVIKVDSAGNGDTATIPITADDLINGELKVRLFVCQLKGAEDAAREAADAESAEHAAEETAEAEEKAADLAEKVEKILETQEKEGVNPESEARFIAPDMANQLKAIADALKSIKALLLKTPLYTDNPGGKILTDELNKMVDPLIADVEKTLHGEGTVENMDLALATAEGVLGIYAEKVAEHARDSQARAALDRRTEKSARKRIDRINTAVSKALDAFKGMTVHLQKTLGEQRWNEFQRRMDEARRRIAAQLAALRPGKPPENHEEARAPPGSGGVIAGLRGSKTGQIAATGLLGAFLWLTGAPAVYNAFAGEHRDEGVREIVHIAARWTNDSDEGPIYFIYDSTDAKNPQAVRENVEAFDAWLKKYIESKGFEYNRDKCKITVSAHGGASAPSRVGGDQEGLALKRAQELYSRIVTELTTRGYGKIQVGAIDGTWHQGQPAEYAEIADEIARIIHHDAPIHEVLPGMSLEEAKRIMDVLEKYQSGTIELLVEYQGDLLTFPIHFIPPLWWAPPFGPFPRRTELPPDQERVMPSVPPLRDISTGHVDTSSGMMKETVVSWEDMEGRLRNMNAQSLTLFIARLRSEYRNGRLNGLSIPDNWVTWLNGSAFPKNPQDLLQRMYVARPGIAPPANGLDVSWIPTGVMESFERQVQQNEGNINNMANVIRGQGYRLGNTGKSPPR